MCMKEKFDLTQRFYFLLILMLLYIKHVYFSLDLCLLFIHTMLFVSMLCFCVIDTFKSIIAFHHEACILLNWFL